jgi:protein-S-isoprenylcysteine O-methyltransferase Ste14
MQRKSEVTMIINVSSAIGHTWEAVGVVWLAAFPFAKRAVRSQAAGGRVFHLLLVLVGFTLLGSHYLRQGWLGMRFLPDSPALGWVGFAVTLAGCGFAIWARMTLGANWSGRAAVKVSHELILSGPYAVARHPIYSGLLLACVGTTLAGGEWRCIAGLALIVAAFAFKMSQEERMMMETFPRAYPQYRQGVKALIPGVF